MIFWHIRIMSKEFPCVIFIICLIVIICLIMLGCFCIRFWPTLVRLYRRLFWTEIRRELGRRSDERYAGKLFPGVKFHIRHLVHSATHKERDVLGLRSFCQSLKSRVTDGVQFFEKRKDGKRVCDKRGEQVSEQGGTQTPRVDSNLQSGIRGKYVVYIDFHYKVRIDAEGDACRGYQSKAQRIIHAKADMLNALPANHLTKTHRLAFKKLVGQLYVCAIENDMEIAEVIYKEAVQYYKSRGLETFRHRQICYSIFIYILAIVILHVCAGDIPEITEGKIPSVQYMMIAGLAGSFLAIFRKAGKREVDPDGTRRVLLFDCLGRAGIAMIMGVLTMCLLQSDFVLAAFHTLSYYSYLVIAFAAGLIDTYIPSLICKSIPIELDERKFTNEQKSKEEAS